MCLRLIYSFNFFCFGLGVFLWYGIQHKNIKNSNKNKITKTGYSCNCVGGYVQNKYVLSVIFNLGASRLYVQIWFITSLQSYHLISVSCSCQCFLGYRMINVIIPPVLVSQQPLGTSTFDQINDVITTNGSSKRCLPFPVCSKWGGKGMLSASWLVLLLSTYRSGTPSSSPPAAQLNHVVICDSIQSPVPHRDIWRCLISAALNSMAHSQRSCPSWA